MSEIIFEKRYGTTFQIIAPPRNWRAIKLEALFTSQHPSAAIRTSALEWVGKNAKDLYTYRNKGLNGTGPGIYEGTALRISACTPGPPIFIGCDDLVAAETSWECDMVVAPARESGRIEWFMESIDGFDCAYLKAIGVIVDADYKHIPYCLTTIPNWSEVTLAALGIFVMVREIVDAIKEMVIITEEFIGRIAGTTATLSAIILMLVAYILKMIAYIAYLYGLTLAVIQFLKDFFNNIIQPKKWKLGMTVNQIMRRICQHLGLTFSSTIFNNINSPYTNVTVMPPKRVKPHDPTNILTTFDRPENETNLNGQVYGYPDGTCGEFLRNIMEVFNVEPVIIGNVCHLELRSFWNGYNPYQIPNTDEIGNTYNLMDPHGTNAHELANYYALFFATDEMDDNTTARYNGSSCSVTLVPNITISKINWLMKKSEIKNFPFAHARRKEHLNKVEEGFNDMLQKAKDILGSNMMQFYLDVDAQMTIAKNMAPPGVLVFHNPAYLLAHPASNNINAANAQLALVTNVANNRIGWLQLSSDHTSVHKLFVGVSNPYPAIQSGAANGADWEVHPQSETRMSAFELMRTFHKENLATRGNQYLLYRARKTKFCCPDWNKVKNSRALITPDGKNGKFDKVSWAIADDLADNDFRVQQNFTNNLVEKVMIDGEPVLTAL